MGFTEKLKPCPFCGGAPRLHAVCGEYWVDCKQGHQGAFSRDLALALFSWERRTETRKEKVVFRGHAARWPSGLVSLFRTEKKARADICDRKSSLSVAEAQCFRAKVVEVKPKKKAKK